MKNPTRTLGIERAWNREINRRWRLMAKAITDYFKDDVVTNAVPDSPAQTRQFMAYLNRQINSILLADGTNWQAQYQLESYERALQRTRASLKAQGATMAITPEDIQLASQLNPAQFTATATLLSLIHI